MLTSVASGQLPLLVAIVAAVSVLLSSGINVVATCLQQWRTRVATERQQLRDLAVKLAIEQWKYEAPLRDKISEGLQAKFLAQYPRDPLPYIPGVSLDETVRHMIALLQAVPAKQKKP